MDKMSKFRRKQKPKPPTIDTSVPRVSTDTTDSFRSDKGPTAVAAAATTTTTASSSAPSSPTSKTKRAAAAKAAAKEAKHKKSPFRGLGLGNYRKRARGSPPAELSSSPPQPAVVGQDGTSSLKSYRLSTDYDHESRARSAQDAPRMPGFLSLSEQDISRQYDALQGAERGRLPMLAATKDGDESRWTQYKQTDRSRGQMDRYSNIKPWNYNRVRLQVPEDQFDYVNASAIELPSISDPTQAPLRYIAMQGPTEASFAYVWRMIAEQIGSPAVIIQLTSMVENGVLKCNQYFPSEEDEATEWLLNEDDVWEDGWRAKLVLDSVEEVADGAIERRKLLLHVKDEAHPRVIWHLLYLKWPDFGVPDLEDLDSFLELMRFSRELNINPSNPRVIHCSAGVGRTGTFISLEHLMRELDLGALHGSTGNSSDEAMEADWVHDTVNLLREQRKAMVQGEQQLRFIYQVMRRLWHDRYGGGGYDSGAEPSAKRLEVGSVSTDPFLDGHSNTEAVAAVRPGIGQTGVQNSFRTHR